MYQAATHMVEASTGSAQQKAANKRRCTSSIYYFLVPKYQVLQAVAARAAPLVDLICGYILFIQLAVSLTM